jgi:predicted phosphodiesterase
MRLFVFLALCTATILTMVQSCVTDVPMDELVQRLDESQTFAFQAAVSNLFLPLGWIIGWLAVLAVLFAVVAALSARPPSQRVIGLVAERLLRFAGAILAVALLSQVGVFVCRYFLERTVLTPDPRWGHFVFDPFLELFIAGYIALLFCQALAGTLRSLDAASRLSLKIAGQYRAGAGRNVQYWLPHDSNERCDVLFLSDLHGLQPDGSTLEGGMSDVQMHAFVNRTLEHARPKVVVLCGDLTDDGSPASFDRLAAVLARPAKGVPLICIPGNHDVHFRRMADKAIDVAGLFRAMFSIDDVDGMQGTNASYGEKQVLKNLRKISSLNGPYPRLITEPSARVHFLLLDSNRRVSSSPVTNAIGLVGREQLAGAAYLINNAGHPSFARIVVLHHHVLPPEREIRAPFLACLDADKVLDLAKSWRASAIVHGHLHMPYVCTCDYVDDQPRQLAVISCGSALFPAIGRFRDEVGHASAFGIRLGREGIESIIRYSPKSVAEESAIR